MTLETIARIEDALQIDLLKSALTYVSGYTSSAVGGNLYLNEPETES